LAKGIFATEKDLELRSDQTIWLVEQFTCQLRLS